MENCNQKNNFLKLKRKIPNLLVLKNCCSELTKDVEFLIEGIIEIIHWENDIEIKKDMIEEVKKAITDFELKSKIFEKLYLKEMLSKIPEEEEIEEEEVSNKKIVEKIVCGELD